MPAETLIVEYVEQWQRGILDGRELVVDILATLRHFADTHAVDFADADRIAYSHYSAECHERRRVGL